MSSIFGHGESIGSQYPIIDVIPCRDAKTGIPPLESYYTVENTDNVIIRLCRKPRRGFRRRRPRKAASYMESSPVCITG